MMQAASLISYSEDFPVATIFSLASLNEIDGRVGLGLYENNL